MPIGKAARSTVYSHRSLYGALALGACAVLARPPSASAEPAVPTGMFLNAEPSAPSVTAPPAAVSAPSEGATQGTSSPAYEAAIDLAVDEHERGNFEEAREHFREAHELYPNARTLRGLGKVEFELRNYGEAVNFLSAALTTDARALSPELRTEVEILLDRARAYIGAVHVDVQPGSATVSVDGVPVASGPKAALELAVGDHVLEFRASGRLSERRQIRVRGRDQITIQVVLLAPESAAGPLVSASQAPRDDTSSRRRKTWLWTLGGVAAVGAAVGIAFAAKRDRSERDLSSLSSSGVILRNP